MSCYNSDKGHGHGGKHDDCCNKRPGGIGMPDTCCTGETGCTDFDRNLSNVKVEPIYVQKVYDAALFHLQSIINGMNIKLYPTLAPGTRIVEVLDIRCRKYFDPKNTTCNKNLTINPTTQLQGASFIEDNNKCEVTAVGPDGFNSQRLIYVDTEDCDEKCKGTPIYGTQNIHVSGNVRIEIDVMVRENCGKRCKVTLKGLVPVASGGNQLNLTNFFELCVPSTNSGAFFPRFTEFCNIKCQPRLATNNISRDFTICKDGIVRVNIMVALCVSCEKKIIVPVQLCVLSTGFTKLSPETSSVCSSYPSLFPNQIDKDSVKECLDNKGDKDSNKPCKPKRPSNDNSCRGLSLSDDETDTMDDLKGL